MRISEVASRYAKATYELAFESGRQEKVLADLRALEEAFASDPQLSGFFNSPLLKSEQRTASLEVALKNSGAAPEVHQLLILLSKKNRLSAFSQVVQAYAKVADAAAARCTVAAWPGDVPSYEAVIRRSLEIYLDRVSRWAHTSSYAVE